MPELISQLLILRIHVSDRLNVAPYSLALLHLFFFFTQNPQCPSEEDAAVNEQEPTWRLTHKAPTAKQSNRKQALYYPTSAKLPPSSVVTFLTTASRCCPG